MRKLINRLNIYRDFVKNKTVVLGLPIEIGIEMTNRCNLKCPMCAREEMTRPIGDMPMELLTKIIDEIACYAELIYLHGDGEPLLHKHIYEAICYARGRKLRVGLSTNATLLTANNARLLLDSGLDYLILPVDGVTKQTYEKIRVNAVYEQVVENIRGFMELKKKRKSKTFVVIQFIEMEQNYKEKGAFLNYWKMYHPQVLRVKPIVALTGARCISGNKTPCFYLWRQSMIDWDGTVFACCADTNSVYNLGNVLDRSLREIWNGPLLSRLRQLHIEKKQSQISICNTCNLPQPNKFSILSSTFVDGLTLKKILPHIENTAYLYERLLHENNPL